MDSYKKDIIKIKGHWKKLIAFSPCLIVLFIMLLPASTTAQEEDFDLDKEMESEQKRIEIEPKIGIWTIDDFGAFRDSTELDTLLDFFQVYNPVFDNALTASYLGNYGLPSLNNNFFERTDNTDFFFLKSRSAYLLTPSQIKYYNTRTPYTQLDFSQSENRTVKNETRFNVFHSQNINPFLNFVFRVNMAKSDGQYNAQQAKNNFVTLYGSYNKKNWNIYTGFISNLIKNKENGGLEYDSLIFKPLDSELLNTNLSSANSGFNSGFNSVHYYTNAEYRLGKTIEADTTISKDGEQFIQEEIFRPILGIMYSFNYQRNNQEYIDEEANDNNFYDHTYFGEDYTKDSVRFNKLTNVAQLKQYENSNRKASFGKRAFLGHEFISATSPGADTVNLKSRDENYSNIFAGGGIFRETGKFWTWNFGGKIYFVGRKAGQTELWGLIRKPFSMFGDSLANFQINGSLDNLVANYFQEEFYSNHFRWNNDFKMEQRMDVSGRFVSPKHKLEVSANYAIINNYLYNNKQGIPSQTGTELLVLSAYADKDFAFRNLHLRTRVLWQKASNQNYIHLPDLSAFVSAYYKFVVSKVMFAQIGIDTRYNTAYYADAYSPATGLFYLQDNKKYGNYPYIDAYANLRLKRTRVFFKLMNIGTRFVDGEYITVPNYPMPRSTFRLGVSWLFYD